MPVERAGQSDDDLGEAEGLIHSRDLVYPRSLVYPKGLVYMRTIVVVHADPPTRETYADWLRDAGYEVVSCGGPQGPDYFCPVLKHCGCLEAEQSDAMIYDPGMVTQGDHPASERILYRLREWYPDKPIIVLNRDDLPPPIVRLVGEDSGIVVLSDVSPESLATALRTVLAGVAAS